jgi:hypothetical protein
VAHCLATHATARPKQGNKPLDKILTNFTMTEEQKIETILSKMEIGNAYVLTTLYRQHIEKNADWSAINSVMTKMIFLKLIKRDLIEYSYDLVSVDVFGSFVLESGGWIEYNKKTKENKKNKEKVENKRFLIPVILTILGLALAGIQIFQAYTQDEQKKQTESIMKVLDSLYMLTNDHLLQGADEKKEILKLRSDLDSLYDRLKIKR